MQMSVGDGMKTIISGGAVTPPFEDSNNDLNSSNDCSVSIDSRTGQSSQTQSE